MTYSRKFFLNVFFASSLIFINPISVYAKTASKPLAKPQVKTAVKEPAKATVKAAPQNQIKNVKKTTPPVAKKPAPKRQQVKTSANEEAIKGTRYVGVVTGILNDTFFVKTNYVRRWGELTVKLTPETKLEKLGENAKATDFDGGDQVEIYASKLDSRTLKAYKVKYLSSAYRRR